MEFLVVHMILEFVLSHLEGMVTHSAAGLRLSFYLSWSHECPGTFGDRIGFLVTTMHTPLQNIVQWHVSLKDGEGRNMFSLPDVQLVSASSSYLDPYWQICIYSTWAAAQARAEPKPAVTGGFGPAWNF
jgi:hypothetical protein